MYLVNLFYFSDRFRLKPRHRQGVYQDGLKELTLYLIIIVKITFQLRCEQQKTPTEHT